MLEDEPQEGVQSEGESDEVMVKWQGSSIIKRNG
jgi:hypothetical protein